MGQLIKASCSECGFENNFGFGAGRSNFKTECMVPALNKQTGEFETLNIYERDLSDENIIFYNDPKMFAGEIQDFKIQFGEIILKSRENFCPGCKMFSIDFVVRGMYD